MAHDSVGTSRYVVLNNNIMKRVYEIGGVNSFGVLFNILLNKNWKNELETNYKILLQQVGLTCSHENIVVMATNLKKLEEFGLVKIIKGATGVNEILKIEVLRFSGGAQTEIKCVNEEILKIKSKVRANTLLAVYCLLQTSKDKQMHYSRIAKCTIAEYLGLSEKTVNTAIDVLENNALITITRSPFDAIKGRRDCNRYRTHDFNGYIYKIKKGIISNPNIVKIATAEEKNEYSRFEEDLEYEKRRDNIIVSILQNPLGFCPCILEGKLSTTFRTCVQ